LGIYRSIHLLIFWILFENVMSMHRAKATIIGLLEASRVNEWVVTEKLGNALANRQRNENKSIRKFRQRIGERFQYNETYYTTTKHDVPRVVLTLFIFAVFIGLVCWSWL